MNKPAKRIGFLATGSEITSGEIINSNSATLAALMQEWGMNIGEHLSCDDDKENIKNALSFLLPRHDAVITIGGLGPTSDDVTRYAVSETLGHELTFHEPSWTKIVERLSKRKLPIPENNRTQAYFPANSVVLTNANGTADGCLAKLDNKLIFMLPGPPHECIAMFNEYVLPSLHEYGFESALRLFRWRLLGVSESAIAEKIEVIAKAFNLNFAYRVSYPFVDVKLMLDPHSKNHSKILTQIEMTVKPYFASHLNQSMTEQLIDYLADSPKTFSLSDTATKGYFLQKMTVPHTETLFSRQNDKIDFQISLTGLTHYWEKSRDNTQDHFTVEIIHDNTPHTYQSEVFLRGPETLEFISQFVALKIMKLL